MTSPIRPPLATDGAAGECRRYLAQRIGSGYHPTRMRWIADCLYLLAALLYAPFALYEAIFLGKNRRGWGQRFGFIPRFDAAAPRMGGDGPIRIWMHAVSLGEVNATPKLVALLRERLPGCEFVFSTTTDTGFARAVQLYGAERVIRFPLDFSVVVGRVLRRVAPAMIVLVELEVWFNLVHMARRRGIPVAVVNGRLTERSARRFSWLGKPVRSMFQSLSWVGAQDEAIARRFEGLGVDRERIEITSSLKWDSAQIADRVEGDDTLAMALGLDRRRAVWVCGSTGPGEEETILQAYRILERQGSSLFPTLCVIPRKPERFEEVASIIRRAGFECVRRSLKPDGSEPSSVAGSAIILGDTLGELRKFYVLASVVFVGRSLVSMGGSDPMEVAALGKPMVVGPFMDNFQEPKEALQRAEALEVVHGADELAAAVGRLLADAESARAKGRRAQEVVRRHQGATQRTADRLIQWVHKTRPS